MLGMLGHSDTNGGVISAVTSTPVYVRALYDYSCNDASALRFRRNDIIEVITQLDSGWWDGRCNGERGWFPSNFVEQVEPGIPESVFVDDDSGLDWKASSDDKTIYPVADESELSRGIIAANQSALNNTIDGDSYATQISPGLMTTGNQQLVAGKSSISQYVNSNVMTSDSDNNTGEIVLAADDYELSDQPSAILRLSRVPPNAWIPQETDEGHIYYFNPTSRVTSWELPPGGHELTAEEATALAAMDADPQYQQFDSSAILDNYLSEANEHGGNGSSSNIVGQSKQHVNSNEGQDGSGNTSSQKPNECKTSSGNRSIDSATKRKAVPMGTEPEIPDNQLPPYWGKKRTPEGRVYYFNMITDETLWSLANVDMNTGKSLHVSASNRSSMHSNASENSIEEAPYFTVHALARTPSLTTPTNVNTFNVDSNNDMSNNGEVRAPLRKPSGFVGKLHVHHPPMNSVDANGYTHNGMGNSEIGITWPRLVALIVLAIHRLNHSAKHTTKSAYIADSLLIVDAISAMLMASGTMQRDSPAIKAHNLLKAHHVHLMNALSKLVLSAKDASRVWPPPDAVQQMQRDANEVLLASRYFMNVAQDVGIPMRSVDGIDVDALEMELSGPTVTATIPTTANHSQLNNSIDNASYDTTYSNGTTLYNRSRSSISSGNGNEALYADQPAASVDLLVRFSQHSHAILQMVSSMQHHLQRLQMDLHHLPHTNQAPANPQTITHAKQMLSVTEQFLQLVDDMRFEHISQESADRLLDARRTLQGEVVCLMMAVQEATDAEADITNIEACLEHLRMVDNTAKELLIASKLQVEERDALRHRALEQNVDRFRAVQRNGDRLEATIRVRRALSMSHVASDGDHIETLMMEHDQMGDSTQYKDEDIQSVLDRNGDNLANYDDINNYMYGNTNNDANGHGNGYGMSSGKKVSMAKARTMNRLHTEPSLHQGATAAAMHTAAKYMRNGELSPNSETEGTLGKGHYFDVSNDTVRQDKYNFLEEEEEEEEEEEDTTSQDEHGEFNVDNYGNMQDRKDDDYEAIHQQPDSYPIPDGLMSVVAPWTVQSPEHGTIPPVKAQSNQVSPPAAGTSAATYNSTNPNRIEMSRKVVQLLGEDVPLSGNTAPVLTSSKPAVEEKPWFLGYDYDESEIVFTVDANVKGGTLRALVERCTLHDALDTTFVNNFLLTYRSFTTSEEFLNLLFKRFQVQPPPGLTSEEMEIWRSKKQKPIQLRVFNIIKQWLEFIYHDVDDSVLLTQLHEFIRTTMSPHLKTSSLLKLIEKRQTKTNDYSLRKLVRNIKQEAPTPIVPKNMKKMKFLDIDPTEFARQLTIMDSGLYNKITPVECLNKAWSKKDNSCAVNIKAMIEISNHLTHWVIESILQEKIPQKRAHLIRHFVAIADRCMSLNNYNSLMAILAGLNSAPIHRLKRTWELISTKTTVVLDMVKARMNQTKNFSTYREGLHSIDPPCVPFLGVYLTDLTFIDDGNPDKLPGTDLINFSKYSKCADVITEIQQYQKLPYCLTTVPQIKLFLERNLQGGRDVQDLYNMSLNMEPREREDEKIARLLHESGFL